MLNRNNPNLCKSRKASTRALQSRPKPGFPSQSKEWAVFGRLRETGDGLPSTELSDKETLPNIIASELEEKIWIGKTLVFIEQRTLDDAIIL